jgi:hypothetical protein
LSIYPKPLSPEPEVPPTELELLVRKTRNEVTRSFEQTEKQAEELSTDLTQKWIQTRGTCS